MMLSEAFDDALAFAHQLHRGQMRKVANVPYVCHLLAVSALVIEDGGSEAEAIAALLHDSIEDQGSRFPGGKSALAEEIGRRYGPEVLRIVEACTEDYVQPKEKPADRRAQWRAFKEAYLEHIRRADLPVRRVSCADSLHNVRALILDYRRRGGEIWNRFRTKTAEDQLWFYDSLARVFLENGTGLLAEELNATVAALYAATGVPRPAQGR